jgi:hypothetical protein
MCAREQLVHLVGEEVALPAGKPARVLSFQRADARSSLGEDKEAVGCGLWVGQ